MRDAPGAEAASSPPAAPAAGRPDPEALEAAYAHCEGLARGHYENFPVGRNVPPETRRHVHALYAFMRTADDFADEELAARPPAERLRLLADWRGRLARAEAGAPTAADGPIFLALAETLRATKLPASLLARLLDAFEMDVTVSRYRDFEHLLQYCERSANPVGRLVLLLHGYRGEEILRLSDAVCTGLQLANHWQDVGRDLEKDRVYLPAADLAKFGCGIEDLLARRADGRFRELLRFEVERARALFREGKPLCDCIGDDLRFEMRLTWLGGSRILDLIEEQGYDTLTRRPSLGLVEKLRLLWRARHWE